MSVQKYKTQLMEELQATTNDFFMAINFDETAILLVKELQVNEKNKEIIKRLIHAEGLIFRQGYYDKANGVTVCEEELAQVTAFDKTTIPTVTGNVKSQIGKEQPQNIDEIFKKFEEKDTTNAVAPLLQHPAPPKFNPWTQPPVIKTLPRYAPKPMTYVAPKDNPWKNPAKQSTKTEHIHSTEQAKKEVEKPAPALLTPTMKKPVQPRQLENPLFIDENPIVPVQNKSPTPLTQATTHPVFLEKLQSSPPMSGNSSVPEKPRCQRIRARTTQAKEAKPKKAK